MSDRKKDHIQLAFDAQTVKDSADKRFLYEPMLSSHPSGQLQAQEFLDKTIRAPLWVSSMTGGTGLAGKINTNLARVCKEFGLGMGLGSCRPILDDDTHLADFNMREHIGAEQPLYANLGIAQLEHLLENGKSDKIKSLIDRLQADGLIIHVNPMQEWFQPEGDKIQKPPIDTIKRVLDLGGLSLIVKEVGQGMGPESLRELMKLPLAAIEFAAFGGTNFARVELLRDQTRGHEIFEPLTRIGHDAEEMLEHVNSIQEIEKDILCKNLIISGGINSFLDGYYLIRKSRLPAVYGQASGFLKHAMEDYDQLHKYVADQVKGLEMAFAYLRINYNN